MLTISQEEQESLSQPSERSATFVGWPDDHPVDSDDAVQAGLYYMGYGDATSCFQCGGKMNKWEPTDNPFIEHARLFPWCAFIQKRLGQDFINIVKRKQSLGEHPISLLSVCQAMTRAGISVDKDLENRAVKRDPMVRSLIGQRFDENVVMGAAWKVYLRGDVLSYLNLSEELKGMEQAEEIANK